MKKLQLFTSILVVIMMIIAPQTLAFAASNSDNDDASSAIQTSNVQSSTANTATVQQIVNLISEGFSVNKSAIYPGDTFNFTFKVKNSNKNIDIKNLNIRLSGNDAFTVSNDIDTIYRETLSKNQDAEFSKNFYVNSQTTAGMYPISVSATYNYTDNGEVSQGSAEFSYTVSVLAAKTTATNGPTQGDTPSLVASFSTSKANLHNGDKFNLNFNLTNKSSQYDISNVNIRLSGGEAFSVASDVDALYSSGIAKSSKSSFSKTFVCGKDIKTGLYPITANVTFEYTVNGEKQQGSSDFTFSVKVNEKKKAKTKKKATPLTPQLIISSFNYGKSTISGGKEFTLTFAIKNNSSSIKAQNVLVKLAGGDAFVVADGTDTISLKSIKPNQTVKVSKKFSCLTSASSGVYPVTATVSYEYIEGGKQSASSDLTMSIPVVQPDKVQFQQIALADKTVNLGEESDCAFQIVNAGQTKLSNGTVKLLNSKGKELNSAYIGNIEAGGQFASNYTLPVTFNDAGDYKLKLVFEYENENMEKKTIEQEFKVKVEEASDPFEPMPGDDTSDTNASDDTTDNKKTIIIAVSCGVGAVVVIAAAVIIKKKKHKKGSVKFDEKI